LDRAVLETASDRYVIVEYLAEGGMGAIYLGKKLGVDGFEKEVVLKQLLPELTSQPKFIDLFLREARLSASLDHANIVRTVDLVNAGDDYFMVMEYVRGGDLRTLMRRARRRRQKFVAQAAVFIGHELLEALAYAHGKTGADGRPLGLIHRDVSPSNILLSGAGEVKLTDFGIAKASTHRSVFYKVKGKVGYMSPEQARGEPVDARSDLFSLGVVLYEVLVGERLFVGDLMSSAAQIYSQKVAPPSKKRADLTSDLDEVILKALSLDPRGRFQSAEEFQEALNRAATRSRLICGASEMAAHLRQVCGDDPSTWLKLEMLGFDDTHAIPQGTAVVSSMEEEDDPFAEPAAAPMRPHAPAQDFSRKELTSVIALHADDIHILGTFESMGEDPPLQPLEPLKSGPVADPHGSRRSANDEARRSGGLGPTRPDELETTERQPRAHAHQPEPQPALPRIKRDRSFSQSGAQTIVRTPAHPPARPAPANPPPRSVPARGTDFSAAEAPTRASNRPPDVDTAGMRRSRRRRPLLILVLLLLLIGIGVALGVAFSGPELEVIDPSSGTTPR
jgi:serine/threonine protein kinase